MSTIEEPCTREDVWIEVHIENDGSVSSKQLVL